jgi:YidC/Oxa1 family membrane protein insertase
VEKRFIIFIVAAIAIIGVYALIDVYLIPKPPRKDLLPANQEVARQDAEVADGDEPNEPEPDNPEQPGAEDPAPADDEATPNESEEGTDPDVDPAAVGDEALLPARTPRSFLTLGSVDPRSGYPFLATFDNRGAAVHRVELSSPRYRELEESLAYVGHLDVTDDPSLGVRVRTVGPGTPAAEAGVQVDDVIVAWNGKAIDDFDDWQLAIRAAEPGDVAALTINRPNATAPVIVKAALTRAPMQIVSVERNEETSFNDPPSFLLHLASGKDIQGRRAVVRAAESMRNRNWEVVPHQGAGPATSLSFRLELNAAEREELGIDQPIAVVKTYQLVPTKLTEEGAGKPTAYDVKMTIRVETEGDSPANLAFVLQGPTGAPSEGWWYLTKIHPSHMFTSLGARDLAYDTVGTGHRFLGAPEIFSNLTDPDDLAENVIFTGVTEPTEPVGLLNYAGVDSQYFVAALLPDAPALPSSVTEPAPFYQLKAQAAGGTVNVVADRKKLLNTSFLLTSQPFVVTADEPFERSYRLFFGPKDTDVLTTYGLEECISYGWFGLVSRPLLWVLHFFESFLRNYALAIMLLTICVRALMFPLGRKAAMNARKMQELGPEMKALREKHKDDFEKLGKAQRELFKRHNYNPFSGCWMIFIQIPIFLGLYRGLSTDIELRGASLIPGLPWASNLAAPDKLAYWGTYPEWLFGYTGWLGPYFNLLPLVTVALFLVQQKLLMPPATDEQTRMQQKLMSYMTLFIGVMFFKVPSGLCIYFITSSLWGITERKLLPKSKPVAPAEGDAGIVAPAKPTPARPSPSRSSGKPGSSRRTKTRK